VRLDRPTVVTLPWRFAWGSGPLERDSHRLQTRWVAGACRWSLDATRIRGRSARTGGGPHSDHDTSVPDHARAATPGHDGSHGGERPVQGHPGRVMLTFLAGTYRPMAE
jgi:hypothetical protein